MAHISYLLCAVYALAAATSLLGCGGGGDQPSFEEDLESFLSYPIPTSSPCPGRPYADPCHGLDFSPARARAVAMREAPILQQSRVTIRDLECLKDVLYNVMYFDTKELQTQLLPLAKQHVDATDLKLMHHVLYDSRLLGLDADTAKSQTIYLVKNSADPGQVYDLYNLMTIYLPKTSAKTKAMELGAIGCDPYVLKTSHADLTHQAIIDYAISADLGGKVRRYASDGELLGAMQFKQKYDGRAQWMTEWLAAPLEKRVQTEIFEYTARQFFKYGDKWEQEWISAQTSTQMRLADNGRSYTMREFIGHYPRQKLQNEWQQKWSEAAVLPCMECKSSQDSSIFNTLRSMPSQASQGVVTV